MKTAVKDIVRNAEIQAVHKFPYGEFFFLSNIIVSEIAEGIIFDWAKGKNILDLGLAHYGKFAQVHFISNRIHDFSVRSQDWPKFINFQPHIITYCIVNYGKPGMTNLLFEKIFFRSQIHHFDNLRSALEFVKKFDTHIKGLH